MTTEVDINIDEKIKQTINEPPKYNVILLNDDATPMDWVIGVLKEVFKHSESDAEALTMKIHNDGSAVAGTYKYEIAEQKALEAGTASKHHGFPLELKVEASE
jgi:ATP-dependent Clp protease adaptor protein ClpS|tara:strand:- start:291 stop:599 length:309 start_codon:yes stop_codon:yes gene_type:complete